MRFTLRPIEEERSLAPPPVRWISASARASSAGGKARPSALADLGLPPLVMANSAAMHTLRPRRVHEESKSDGSLRWFHKSATTPRAVATACVCQSGARSLSEQEAIGIAVTIDK